MKGIILAAGRGSRMGSLTVNHPKCKTIVNGKELIQWQLDSLQGGGLKEIAIVKGYMGEMFNYKLKYFENKHWENTNMVVSLLAARDWLRHYTCIISYSDIIYSSNAIRKLAEKNTDIVIAYDPNWRRIWDLRFEDPLTDAETFKLDGDRIIEIGNKTTSINSIDGQYMGIFKFKPSIWKDVENYLLSLDKKILDRMDITSLLQRLINKGYDIYAVPILDRWFEFDNQKDLEIFKSIYPSK